MRIALIALAVAALAFVGSIIWLIADKNGVSLAPNKNSDLKISNEGAMVEILRSQIKTEEKLKNLEAKMELMQGGSINNTQPSVASGGTANTASGVMTDAKIVPISAKFLSKIIQKVSPTLDKNNGIFGLYIFDTNTEYSTYIDPKYQMTIVASRTPFDTFKKNFNSLDKNLYTINGVNTLGFPAFYVNPPKADSWVRLVMQVEAQTLLITLPKTKFNEFKNLLNKR